MKRLQLMVALLMLCALTGCALTTPPQAKEGLLPPIAVRDRLVSAPGARQQLMPQGYWILAREGDQRDERTIPKLGRGELVWLTPHRAEEEQQLFVVVETRAWGAILERLDYAPLPSGGEELEVELVRASVAQLMTEAFGARQCEDSSQAALERCLAGAPQGLRYDLYAMNADGRIQLEEFEPDRPRLSAGRVGVAWRGLADDPVQQLMISQAAQTKGKKLIAIPKRFKMPSPATARVALDARCSQLQGLAKHSSPFISFERVDDASIWRVPQGPAQQEQATFAALADLWLSCEGGDIIASVPSLWRPTPQTATGQEVGLALLSARALNLGALKDKGAAGYQVELLAALGQVALGDWSLADAYFDRLIARGAHEDLGPDHDLILSGAAQIIALTRPEAGLTLNRFASRGAWSRETHVPYLISQIAAMAGLDQSRQLLDVETTLGEQIQRDPRSPWRAWLAWRSLARELNNLAFAFSNQPQRLEQGFSEDPKQAARWMEGVYLELKRYGQLSKDLEPAVERRLKREGLEGLWLAVKTPAAIQAPCPAEGECALDSYGRRVSALLSAAPAQLPQALMWRAKLPYQPGFSALTKAKDLSPAGQLGRLIYAADSAQARAQSTQYMRALGQALATDKAQLCAQVPAMRALTSKLPDAEVDAQRRALLSISTDGVAQICAAGLLEATNALGLEEPGLTLALIEGYLEHAEPSEWHLTLIERAVTLATQRSQQQLNSSCARWSLVMSLVKLRQSQTAAAQRFLLEAINCAPAQANIAQEIQVLEQFIAYARTGRYSPATPAISARLEAARSAPDAQCPGLQDRRPQLQLALSPWLWRLAGRFEVNVPKANTNANPGQDAQDPDALMLWTSEETIKAAQADLQEGARQLAEGQLTRAAAALLMARDGFMRASYTPGQRVSQTILDVLFERLKDNEQAIIASDEEPPTSYGPTKLAWLASRLSAGQAALLHAELVQLDDATLSQAQREVLLALTLLFEGSAPVLKMPSRYASTKAYNALCSP